MAVEMCKLSLWLVSLDPKLPFSFVDDKILHGNSLLGLTDVKQLKHQHIDPDAAQHAAEPVRDRRGRRAPRRPPGCGGNLASEVNNADPQRSVNTKRRQWHRFQEVTAELTDIADAVVATGLQLGGKPGRALNVAYENLGDRPRRGIPGQRPVRQRPRPDHAGRDPGDGPHAHGPDGLRAVEAAALDHRGPGRHGTGRLRRHHRQPAVPRGPEATGAMGTNMRDWLVETPGRREEG